MIGGVFRHMLSHLSGVPHLHVTGAKNPSWPESNQLAIYKHGGGPELQPTEKNQRSDFGGTTVPCSIFFLKFPRVLMYAFHILRKVRKLKCVSFFRSSIYVWKARVAYSGKKRRLSRQFVTRGGGWNSLAKFTLYQIAFRADMARRWKAIRYGMNTYPICDSPL